MTKPAMRSAPLERPFRSGGADESVELGMMGCSGRDVEGRWEWRILLRNGLSNAQAVLFGRKTIAGTVV